MLGYAALRAVWRQLRGLNAWEKTTHTGAHRALPEHLAVVPAAHESSVPHG
jgi:hypothetical protein